MNEKMQFSHSPSQQILAKDTPFLFDLLDKGNEEEFLRHWYKIRRQGEEDDNKFHRLTFYVHLFFTVRAIRRHPRADCHTLESTIAFKNYLWANGASFSGEVDLVPYFMLPFVPDPRNNPTFSELFDESWEIDFRNNLRQFLEQNQNGFEKESPTNKRKSKTGKHFSANCWKIRYHRLYQKFQHLYEDMRLMTNILSELIMALEKSTTDEPIDFSTVLSIHNNAYKSPSDDASQTLAITDRKPDEKSSEIVISPSPNYIFHIQELDIEKIKTDLSNSNVKTKLLLLQALRWGITRSSVNERHSMVWLITQHDILHLHEEEATFLRSMLMPNNSNAPHPTQQTTIRLLNALIVVKMGFDYVASPQVAELLVQLVRNCEYIESDAVTSDLLVALLQKISWVYYLGELMIERNLLEWLVKKLFDSVEWNYSLRNCLLLLLSLTRYRSAKRICLHRGDELLSFLTKFLNGECKSAETCGSIFWKFCAYLENILVRKDFDEEDWNFMSQKFSLSNSDILCNYLRHQEMQNENYFEPQIDANDPLNTTPNGAEFLRLNYSSN